MQIYRNVAGQKLKVFAFIPSTSLPRTGDAANLTAYVRGDGGTLTALADTTATEVSSTNAPGWYEFDLSQAETNYADILFTAKSSTADTEVIAGPASVVPPNFSIMSLDATGALKIQARLRRNQAIPVFQFSMTDSTTHNLKPSATGITVLRVLSNNTFAAIASPTVTELANGYYWCALAAADLNDDTVSLYITGSGCDPLPIHLFMDPA